MTIWGDAADRLLARWTRGITVADQRSANQRVHDGMRDPQTRVYGHAGTINGSEQLNVEVTAAGEVVAVWFRCQQLPFRQGFADGTRASSMRETSRHAPRLVAVEVIDQ